MEGPECEHLDGVVKGVPGQSVTVQTVDVAACASCIPRRYAPGTDMLRFATMSMLSG